MINSSNLVLKGIKTDFAKQLSGAENSRLENMAFVSTEKSAYSDYLIFDAMPAIYQWTSSKMSGSKIKDYKIRVENKPYQTMILENRRTMEYSEENLSSNVQMQINGSVSRWNSFIDKLIVELLEANGTAYDGSTFFANSHNIESTGAIDNLYPTTGTSLAQVTADYAGAIAALQGYLDKNGDPFNDVFKPLVIAPVNMEQVFLTLQNAMTVNSGDSNIYAKTFDLIVSPRLESSKWYIYNTAAIFPAVILQKPNIVNWTMKDDPEDIFVKFLADADFGVSLGNFTSIIKIA